MRALLPGFGDNAAPMPRSPQKVLSVEIVLCRAVAEILLCRALRLSCTTDGAGADKRGAAPGDECLFGPCAVAERGRIRRAVRPGLNPKMQMREDVESE
eukprot:2398371-Rhodomonas_salina.1